MSLWQQLVPSSLIPILQVSEDDKFSDTEPFPSLPGIQISRAVKAVLIPLSDLLYDRPETFSSYVL